MQLRVDGNTQSDYPTDLDITRALSELAAGEHQTVTLDNSPKNMVVRVGRGSDGAFILEVIDQRLNSTMQSAEHFLDSATVTDVFLSVLAGDDRWKSETTWIAVQRTPTRSKLSKWIWAFLVFDFVITLIIILVIFLVEGN